MPAVIDLTEAETLQALGDFLTEFLPSSVEVIRGQDNRVSEPGVTDFVVMTPILRERISTNEDSYVDALFTGSISGTVLTITNVAYGDLAIGRTIFGVGITPGTTIESLGTGTGGLGTYNVNISQSVGPITIAAGVVEVLQPVKVTVQLDVHGPHGADNAHIIATLMRDELAVEQLASSGFDVTPLYADEPHQSPFTNDEQQIEYRWVVDAVLECNPILTVPQEFFDAFSVNLISVDVVYPP